MKRLYAFLFLCTIATAVHAQKFSGEAWKPNLNLPPTKAVSPQLQAHINEQVAAVLAHIESAQQKAMATAERLIAQADYDFTINSVSDSCMLTYSNGRGSSFNYESLAFEFYDPFDFPTNGPVRGPGLQFDTMRTFKPTPEVFISARVYNAAQKPLTSLYRVDSSFASLLLFDYNPSGLPSKITFMNQQPNSGLLDSTFRDFYTYNSNGFLTRDSGESWDGSAWTPSSVVVYTPNAAGYPVLVQTYYAGTASPASELAITYTASNKRSVAITRGPATAGGSMVNSYKDSFAYSGTMLTVFDNYRWNATNSNWTLYRTSRSRLNPAGLRDSVVRTYFPGTGAPTITIYKLVYDTYGNPIVEDYSDNVNGLTARRHFYYETYTATGVEQPGTKISEISFYPNPASSSLNIKGLEAGLFSILNSLGQAVQESAFDHGNIPITTQLPVGRYVLMLKGDNGKSYTASFNKE